MLEKKCCAILSDNSIFCSRQFWFLLFINKKESKYEETCGKGMQCNWTATRSAASRLRGRMTTSAAQVPLFMPVTRASKSANSYTRFASLRCVLDEFEDRYARSLCYER